MSKSQPPVLPQHPSIGDHNEWKLFVDLSDGHFVALKGRKERRSPSLRGIKRECDDEDFKVERAAERAKHRVEPCFFTYYDDKKQEFHEVELTSYSDRGVALRPAAGGDTIYVKENYNKSVMFMLVGQEKRVHEAIEGLRRAQEAYRLAIKGNLHEIKLPTYGEKQAWDLAVHEDRIRGEILSKMKVKP